MVQYDINRFNTDVISKTAKGAHCATTTNTIADLGITLPPYIGHDTASYGLFKTWYRFENILINPTKLPKGATDVIFRLRYSGKFYLAPIARVRVWLGSDFDFNIGRNEFYDYEKGNAKYGFYYPGTEYENKNDKPPFVELDTYGITDLRVSLEDYKKIYYQSYTNAEGETVSGCGLGTAEQLVLTFPGEGSPLADEYGNPEYRTSGNILIDTYDDPTITDKGLLLEIGVLYGNPESPKLNNREKVFTFHNSATFEWDSNVKCANEDITVAYWLFRAFTVNYNPGGSIQYLIAKEYESAPIYRSGGGTYTYGFTALEFHKFLNKLDIPINLNGYHKEFFWQIIAVDTKGNRSELFTPLNNGSYFNTMASEDEDVDNFPVDSKGVAIINTPPEPPTFSLSSSTSESARINEATTPSTGSIDIYVHCTAREFPKKEDGMVLHDWGNRGFTRKLQFRYGKTQTEASSATIKNAGKHTFQYGTWYFYAYDGYENSTSSVQFIIYRNIAPTVNFSNFESSVSVLTNNKPRITTKYSLKYTVGAKSQLVNFKIYMRLAETVTELSEAKTLINTSQLNSQTLVSDRSESYFGYYYQLGVSITDLYESSAITWSKVYKIAAPFSISNDAVNFSLIGPFDGMNPTHPSQGYFRDKFSGNVALVTVPQGLTNIQAKLFFAFTKKSSNKITEDEWLYTGHIWYSKDNQNFNGEIQSNSNKQILNTTLSGISQKIAFLNSSSMPNEKYNLFFRVVYEDADSSIITNRQKQAYISNVLYYAFCPNVADTENSTLNNFYYPVWGDNYLEQSKQRQNSLRPCLHAMINEEGNQTNFIINTLLPNIYSNEYTEWKIKYYFNFDNFEYLISTEGNFSPPDDLGTDKVVTYIINNIKLKVFFAQLLQQSLKSPEFDVDLKIYFFDNFHDINLKYSNVYYTKKVHIDFREGPKFNMDKIIRPYCDRIYNKFSQVKKTIDLFNQEPLENDPRVMENNFEMSETKYNENFLSNIYFSDYENIYIDIEKMFENYDPYELYNVTPGSISISRPTQIKKYYINLYRSNTDINKIDTNKPVQLEKGDNSNSDIKPINAQNLIKTYVIDLADSSTGGVMIMNNRETLYFNIDRFSNFIKDIAPFGYYFVLQAEGDTFLTAADNISIIPDSLWASCLIGLPSTDYILEEFKELEMKNDSITLPSTNLVNYVNSQLVQMHQLAYNFSDFKHIPNFTYTFEISKALSYIETRKLKMVTSLMALDNLDDLFSGTYPIEPPMETYYGRIKLTLNAGLELVSDSNNYLIKPKVIEIFSNSIVYFGLVPTVSYRSNFMGINMGQGLTPDKIIGEENLDENKQVAFLVRDYNKNNLIAFYGNSIKEQDTIAHTLLFNLREGIVSGNSFWLDKTVIPKEWFWDATAVDAITAAIGELEF